MYTHKKAIICPLCTSKNTIKKGKENRIQTYLCKSCGRRFRGKERERNNGKQEEIFNAYVFNKQSIRELKEQYGLSKNTLLTMIKSYQVKEKIHTPRPVYVIADATYFGSRKDGTSWCVVVLRDYHTKENLVWEFTDKESEKVYARLRYSLEEKGYVIKGVTGDGFTGIRKAFLGIPFQMCHVHMIRIVLRATTHNPKTNIGKDLYDLVHTLSYIDETSFRRLLQKYYTQHKLLLEERTYNQYSKKKWWYVRRELRSAYYSILMFLPYLFTCKTDNKIESTTNSLEGHFRHIKHILGVHPGTSRWLKQHILDAILTNGSIVKKRG